MKRLHLIILLGLLGCMQSLHAQEPQDEGEQLLVFRNTGVVDLLYTNEVDSVLTNDTTQVFFAKDTVLVVPLAELDSVAIGSRNQMELHEDVRELSSSVDQPWIVRFDGSAIYYRKDTPADILPTVGMKLFCKLHSATEQLFPYGLCARVTAIEQQATEIRIAVERVRLEDIFSKLFLAGPVHTEVDVPLSRMNAVRKAPVNAEVDLGYTLSVEDKGDVSVTGKLKVSGNVVIGFTHKHADLNLEYGYGIGVKLNAKENGEVAIEKLSPEVKIGTFYGILNLEAAAGAFLNLQAELSLGMDIERTYKKKLFWTRKGDDSTFEYRDAASDEPYTDEAQFDITLNGDLFFGPLVRIDFVTIGDLIGARAKLKVGPEIEGTLSLGMLQDMRNYQSKAYGNAELTVRSKVAVEGFVTSRKYLIMGEVEEHKVFDRSFPFAEHSLKLFPDYTQSNATSKKAKEKPVVVDAATAIPKPTPTDIETGFEIVDPQGEIVDSVFVGTIEAEPEDTSVVQTFTTEIELPAVVKQEELEGYTMRPIFHYAGYTISAAPTGIKKDVLLQPYTATQSNGAMMFLSSGPFQGSAIHEGTLYQVGAYLPVPLKKNIYKQDNNSPITMGNHIDEAHAEMLLGTWRGVMNGNEVVLTFEENGKGSHTVENTETFSYELNQPQSGNLLLTFEESSETLILIVLSVTEQELKVMDKRDDERTVVVMRR